MILYVLCLFPRRQQVGTVPVAGGRVCFHVIITHYAVVNTCFSAKIKILWKRGEQSKERRLLLNLIS